MREEVCEEKRRKSYDGVMPERISRKDDHAGIGFTSLATTPSIFPIR
jgi:hypothetical protein